MASDRPDAAELLDAIREFLENDVMAATEGRVQFHTRVAINGLNMVTRELRMDPTVAARVGFGSSAAWPRGSLRRTGSHSCTWSRNVWSARIRVITPATMFE